MEGALQIVIWKQTGLHQALNLIGSLAGGGLVVMALKKPCMMVLEGKALHGLIALMMFTMMFTVGYVVGIRRQGNIEIRDGVMTVSVLLRPTRVFDLSKTRVTVEPMFNGGGTTSAVGVLGPMLVFGQGFADFRIGCMDHGLASAIQGHSNPTPRRGDVRTTAAELLELADRVGVEIPRPAGWQYVPGPLI